MESVLSEKITAFNNDYKVLVTCMTYNQSKTIIDTLRGVAMQMTNFPFICLVIDDCSNDGQRDIISKYVEGECNSVSIEEYNDELIHIIIAKSKRNDNCTFVFNLLKKNLFRERAKKDQYTIPWQRKCLYEAYCEGDDFWISPIKLQNQYDFLEANKDYTLVGSNGYIVYEDCSQGVKYFNDCHITQDVEFEQLVNTWYFPTASLFFRTSIWNSFPKWNEEIHFTDDIIVMTCAINGRVACLGDVTCVYRKGIGITKEMDRNQEYMASQHKLFYTHLLEDTGDKYKDILLARINRDEQNRLFWHLKSKSVFLATLRFPKRFLGMTIRRYIHFL